MLAQLMGFFVRLTRSRNLSALPTNFYRVLELEIRARQKPRGRNWWARRTRRCSWKSGKRNEVNLQILAMLAGFFNVELFKAKWLEWELKRRKFDGLGLNRPGQTWAGSARVCSLWNGRWGGGGCSQSSSSWMLLYLVELFTFKAHTEGGLATLGCTLSVSVIKNKWWL
jgi:hypothetical protein